MIYLKLTDRFITVYTGHTMEKQVIKTTPDLLLEIVNTLAVSQALNMQQKLSLLHLVVVPVLQIPGGLD